jgi:hypothetical protein
MAELAKEAVGPDGNVVRVHEEDAPLLRSAFIGHLADAAMKILDEESEAGK